jgi:acetolactate synthase-1/2/3 large subunit
MAVEKPEEVRPALERSLEVKDRPCIMDFQVTAEENVFPMVPAGGSLDELMIDPALWKSLEKKRERKAG